MWAYPHEKQKREERENNEQFICVCMFVRD